ncbi:hypothetical protein KBD49_06255 [Myxococcota bacterium]|nr:hypothetical protein [Myxococcota bacterium]
MEATLKNLLTLAVDDASVFPPAALDLTGAMLAHARLARSEIGWMLGRFVVPVARLPESKSLAQEIALANGNPWRISVILGGGDNEVDVLGRIRTDGDIMATVRARGSGPRFFSLEAVEARLPRDVQATMKAERARSFCVRSLEALEDAVPSAVDFFVEGSAEDASEEADRMLVEGLADVGGTARFGAKIRCGGTQPESFPPVERVARMLSLCAAHGVPLKATGGLHVPFRRIVGEHWHHGFINLLVASALIHGKVLADDEIAQCIGETDPKAFFFGPDAVSWRGHRAPASLLAKARKNLLVAFGTAFPLRVAESVESL